MVSFDPNAQAASKCTSESILEKLNAKSIKQSDAKNCVNELILQTTATFTKPINNVKRKRGKSFDGNVLDSSFIVSDSEPSTSDQKQTPGLAHDAGFQVTVSTKKKKVTISENVSFNATKLATGIHTGTNKVNENCLNDFTNKLKVRNDLLETEHNSDHLSTISDSKQSNFENSSESPEIKKKMSKKEKKRRKQKEPTFMKLGDQHSVQQVKVISYNLFSTIVMNCPYVHIMF